MGGRQTREITITWSEEQFYYNGLVQHPTAIVETGRIGDEEITFIYEYEANINAGSLIDEFKNNILNHVSLQDAMIKVASEMDSIATVSGSCRQAVKDVYLDDLEKYKETFELSNYSSNGIAILESLLIKGISEIQLSFDLDSSLFEIAVAEAKAAMDAVQTLKDEAVAELEEYRATFDESKYSPEAITELDKILSDFIKAEIEPNQIESAVTEAKAAMDAVLSEVN